jgi:hypothetical protein
MIEEIVQTRVIHGTSVKSPAKVARPERMSRANLFHALHILKEECLKSDATPALRSTVCRLQGDILKSTLLSSTVQPLDSFFKADEMKSVKESGLKCQGTEREEGRPSEELFSSADDGSDETEQGVGEDKESSKEESD